MSYRQTNGIPQGSVLMDFIAEIVLGYADYLFSIKMKEAFNDIDYKYIKAQVQGKKEIPGSGLTLKGGVGAEYGKYDNNVESMDQKELTLKAKGGISFKSKSLNADLFANATTSKTTINYMEYEPTTRRTNTSTSPAPSNSSTNTGAKPSRIGDMRLELRVECVIS